jgi:hypothetical protein
VRPEETKDLTGQEIFDEAVAESMPEASTEEEEEEPKAEERARDEKGRFVAKDKAGEEEEPPAEPVGEPEPVVEQPKEEKPDHRIPLVELLNEREKRQRAEQERAVLEQNLWQLQQQLQALQQPQEPIDPLTDPDRWQQSLNQSWEEKFRSMEANFSLRLAHYKHGDLFMEAFRDVTSRPLNDPIRQQVIQSPDPGETLVALYQKEKLMKEVGPDPQAFIQKKLEEALNDPQFLAKALEKAKGVAKTQPTQKIDLPPSLNKVAAAANVQGDDDVSDRGLYAYATR